MAGFEDIAAQYKTPTTTPDVTAEEAPAAPAMTSTVPADNRFLDLVEQYAPGSIKRTELAQPEPEPGPLPELAATDYEGRWAQGQLQAANVVLQDLPAAQARELLTIAREDDITPYQAHGQLELIKELRSINQLQRTVEGARVLSGYLGPNYVLPMIRDHLETMGTTEQNIRTIFERANRGTDVVGTGYAGTKALIAGRRADPRAVDPVLEYPNAAPLVGAMAEQAPIMGTTAGVGFGVQALGALLGAIGGPGGARAGWQAAKPVAEVAQAGAGFMLEAGNMYHELSTYVDPDTGLPLDLDVARGASVAYGLVAGVLEAKGVDIVINGLPPVMRRQLQKLNRGLIARLMETKAGRIALSRFGRGMADVLGRGGSEAFTEMAQETFQNFMSAIAKSDAEAGVGGALAAGGRAVLEGEGVAEAATMGAEAGFGYAAVAKILKGGSRWLRQAADAKRAIETANRLEEAAAVAVEVGLPEHIERSMQNMIVEEAGGGTLEVPIEALDRLYQGEVPEALQEAAAEARATGGNVTISSADVMQAARVEGFDQFIQDVSSSGRPSLRQATETIKQTMERLEVDLAADVETQATELYRQIYTELTAAGRTADLAHTEAVVETGRWEALAAGSKLDVTGAELRKRYSGGIVREPEGPQSFGAGRLQQAAETGYLGLDIHEAGEWIAAEQAGLDLSDEARQERAEQMGFELTTDHDGAPIFEGPLGTRSVYDAFDPEAKARRAVRLPGAPDSDRVFPPAVAAAQAYAAAQGIPYVEQALFAPVDARRATQIAKLFDDMAHAPHDPLVKRAYQQMIKETLAQYEAVLATGLVVDFDPGDGRYYPNGPRDAIKDVVENNHIYVFSTKDGFGSDDTFDPIDNPLLAETKYRTASGEVMLANDVFRVVHDYFGHVKHGNGFRARGEENAWQAHAAMYSPLARRAMTTETRGQNSWVNFGPYAEHNKTASGADTKYAAQKIGLLPIWVSEDGRLSAADRTLRFQRDLQAGRTGFEGAIDEFGFVELVHYSNGDFTVTDPSRWGRGLSRNVRSERASQLGGAPGRTYFGIEGATTNGYQKEVGLGGRRYIAHVPGELIYDPRKDPDGIWDSRDPGVERNIRDAGYIGYYVNHPKLGKVVALFDPVAVNEDAGGRLYQSSVKLREGRQNLSEWLVDTRPLTKAGKKRKGAPFTTRQVAEALEARQRKLSGVIEKTDRSVEAEQKIARWIVEEVKYAMTLDADESGVGWYSIKYGEALMILAREFPELAHSVPHRDLMTALIAVTSDGQKVAENFLMGVDFYRGWKRTGRLQTTRSHARAASINENIAQIQEIIDNPEQGFSYLRVEMMEEMTVSELVADYKRRGLKVPNTGYQAHIRIPRSALAFGPKLGAFFANLMGAQGYLTMDRWWSRTFNRYRGTLIPSVTEASIKAWKKMRGRPDMTMDEIVADIEEVHAPFDKRGNKTQLALMVGRSEPGKKEEKPAWVAEARAAAGDRYAALLVEHKAERKSHSIWKKLHTEINDVPFNATDRTFMLKTVARAQKSLKRAGIDITIADIQAVLWYYEKRLYAEMGAKGTADDSYEEAATAAIDSTGRPSALESGGAQENGPENVAGDRLFQEAPRSREELYFKDVVKKIPEVVEAAGRLAAGEISGAEYRAIADWYKPVTAYKSVPKPASQASLNTDLTQRQALLVNAPVEEGAWVGLRLDINAYTRYGTWIVSMHKSKDTGVWVDGQLDPEAEVEGGFMAGAPASYRSVAAATQVSFGVHAREGAPGGLALNIASDVQKKSTIATMRGRHREITPDEAYRRAAEALQDPAWTQVGMDPDRRSFFYERGTMRPVEHASEVIQIGPLVLAKDVTFGQEDDYLFQPGPKAPRGWIDLNLDRPTITLTARADQSTFMHESTHMYLHMLQKLELEGVAGEQQLKDLATLREWTGKPPGHVFTAADVDAHEQIARGFEAYLLEGNAPIPELRGAFRRLHSFMVQIYRGVRQLLDVEQALTPQIREVFDRSVATEDAIAKYKASQQRLDVTGLVDAGTVEELDQQWEETVTEASNRGRDQAMRSAIASYRKERRERKAELQDTVTEELNDRPVYRALKFLLDGTGLDIPHVKLNRQAVRDTLGTRGMPETLKGKRTTEEGGIHPDTLAPMFGYDSGAEMLADMAAAQPLHRAIKQLTEQRLEAEYPMDPTDNAAMAEVAAESWHSEARARYLETLIRALGKGRVNMRQLAQAQARELIAKIPLKDMTPGKYLRAEHQVRKQQAEAIAAGDKALARDLLLKELLLHYMYLEAKAVIREYDSLRKLVVRLQKPKTRGRYGKILLNGERPFLSALDGLTGFIDTTELTYRKLNNIPMHQVPAAGTMTQVKQAIDMIAAADPTVDVAISAELLQWQYQLNYRAMTPQQIRDMTAALRSLHHVAIRWDKFRIAGELMDREAVVNDVIANIEANATLAPREHLGLEPEPRGVKAKWTWLRDAMRGNAMLPEVLVMDMDGGEPGFIHRVFYHPFKVAEQYRRELRKTFLVEKFDPIYKRMQARSSGTVTFMGGTITREYLYGIALNLGTQSNTDKFLRGELLAERFPLLNAQTDRDEIVAQLALAGFTTEDWQLVQEVWDLIEEMKPLTFDIAERATGLKPPEVPAVEIVLPRTTGGALRLRGGYYPMKYDTEFQNLWQANLMAQNAGAEALWGASGTRANVAAGFHEARTNFAAPVRLDMGGVFEHVMDTTHYAAFYDAVTTAYHIIQNYRVKGTIVARYGKPAHRALESMVQDVAKQGRREASAFKAVEPLLRDARATVTTAFFGGRVLTLIDTALGGIATAASTVSPGAFMDGMKAVLANPSIMATSTVLKDRGLTFTRELEEQQAILSDPTIDPRRRLLALSTTTLMWPLGRVQQWIDTAVWAGTYAQLAKSGVTDVEELARRADAAVTTLSPVGTMHGMSQFQRGNEFEKSLTAFMSWTVPIISNSWRLWNRGKRGKGYGDLVQYTVLAAMMPSLIAAFLRQETPDEDDDWADITKWAVATFMLDPYFGGVPMFNALGKLVKGDGLEHSLATDMVAGSAVKGAVAVFDVLTGEKDLDELTGAEINGMLMMVSAGSVLTTGLALPVSQVGEAVKWFHVSGGDIDDIRDLLKTVDK